MILDKLEKLSERWSAHAEVLLDFPLGTKSQDLVHNLNLLSVPIPPPLS